MNRESGLTLVEIADGIELPDIMVSTGCNFEISENLKPMQQIDIIV